MIGGGFTGVSCGTPETPSALVSPSGTPDYYSPDQSYEGAPPEGYYFVQGVHTWQAQCLVDTAASATADWGDNLTGDAKLKVGSPIRVELGLETANTLSLQGFEVFKLEPEKLDRESAYGTLATQETEGAPYVAEATAPDFVRVFDGGVTFSVLNTATGVYAVPVGTAATAEINATGRVVYGYNLRVTAAGTYRITFVTQNVTLTNASDGTNTIWLDINVVAGGGGGGKPH